MNMPFRISKQKKAMTLDGVLANVSYEDADLLIRFYNSLLPWQKTMFKATMKKQLKGGFASDLAKNRPEDVIDAEETA